MILNISLIVMFLNNAFENTVSFIRATQTTLALTFTLKEKEDKQKQILNYVKKK